MEEETIVETETTENTEEVETEATETTEESLEEVKSRLAKAEELAKNYKVRAEKAEGKAKETKVEPKSEGLSTTDTIYLAKAEIHDEDLEEVVDMAKLKKISVREAHAFMLPILKDRDEKRKTADVTNTGAARRGSQKTTAEELIAKAKNEGIVPDSDAEIDRLMRAVVSQKRG